MRTLSESDLLELWEAGARRHPLDRALLILAAALPEQSHDRLADWPLGRRNEALARLHCGRPRSFEKTLPEFRRLACALPAGRVPRSNWTA